MRRYPKIRTLFRLPGFHRPPAQVRRSAVASGLVLVYHRIATEDVDPWELCVSPKHFAEHLEVLNQMALTAPLRALDGIRRGRDGSRHAVALTFDDGYADNYETALPLLERYDTPATFFLTTGSIDNPNGFWWDELASLILGPTTLPPTLSLSIRDVSVTWTHDAPETRAPVKKPIWEGPAGSREALYYELWQRLLPLDDEERRAVLETLAKRLGVAKLYRPDLLSRDDVVRLSRSELVEVGAHTVTHPALPEKPVGTQRKEIRESKHVLEDLVGTPVTRFAYPYGRYTTETAALVREAGFVSAYTTDAGLVRTGRDPYQQPRLHVRDWGGDRFRQKIATYLHPTR